MQYNNKYKFLNYQVWLDIMTSLISCAATRSAISYSASSSSLAFLSLLNKTRFFLNLSNFFLKLLRLYELALSKFNSAIEGSLKFQILSSWAGIWVFSGIYEVVWDAFDSIVLSLISSCWSSEHLNSSLTRCDFVLARISFLYFWYMWLLRNAPK